MIDTALLKPIGADPWLSPPVLSQPERHGVAGVLCDYRLYAPLPLDRSEAHQADLRNVCDYFLGLASETELLAHLNKLKQQDAAKGQV